MMTINYIVLDIENDTSNKYGCKAGNFKYDDIVALALRSPAETHARYVYPDKVTKLDLEGIDLLVGHNITHDLLFLWHLEDLQDFFKRGGRVWDTQYAHYCLTGQQDKYPSLRDIAVRCYGCPERTKLMEEYWDKGVKTSDIPKELVLEDVSKDVEDTEQIYLQQIEKAKKFGMTNLIELEMDAILATTEMRYNGMFIDKNVLLEEKIKLEKQLQEQYEILKQITKKYWE